MGGPLLTLSGSSFGLSPTVLFGGRECPLDDGSPQTHSELVCRLPSGEGAGLPVSVHAAGQVSAPGVSFSYSPPALDQVSPASGPTSGATLITITGGNFGRSPSVSVGGGVCAEVTVAPDDASLTCATPEGQGSSNELVVDVGGQIAFGTFSYDPPSLASVSAASFPTKGGTVVTLQGESFGRSPSVTVGGATCPLLSASHDEARCELPAGERTAQPVLVAVANQATEPLLVDYDPPAVLAVTPSTGPTAGGTTLTIHGESFGASPSVTIGGATCPVSRPGYEQVQCTLPAGQSAELDVSVTASGQSSTSAGLFSYRAPTLESISPTTVPAEGGVSLTIEGADFGLSPGVTVGGGVCPVSSASDDTIVCTTPPVPAGQQSPIYVESGNQGSNQIYVDAAPPDCPAGTELDGGECVTCPPGTSSPGGGEPCAQCDVGRFQAAPGGSTCTSCNPGFFQDVRGQTTCKTCAPGSAQPETGASSCLFCAAGSFTAEQGRTSCDSCAPGSFQDTAGQTTCLDCVNTCEGCDGDVTCSAETGQCPVVGSCPNCGDGIIDTGEECDDGDLEADDGCTECSIDEGYSCTYGAEEPSDRVYVLGCGDGVRQDDEGCEDGDLDSGDGCSSLCVLEEGWTCTEDEAA